MSEEGLLFLSLGVINVNVIKVKHTLMMRQSYIISWENYK